MYVNLCTSFTMFFLGFIHVVACSAKQALLVVNASCKELHYFFIFGFLSILLFLVSFLMKLYCTFCLVQKQDKKFEPPLVVLFLLWYSYHRRSFVGNFFKIVENFNLKYLTFPLRLEFSC